MTDKAIQNVVRNLRLERKLPRADLVRMMNVHYATIKALETGVNSPTVKTIKKFCDAIGITRLEFWQRVEDEENKLNE